MSDPYLMCHGSVAEFCPAPCGREHAHLAHPLGISPDIEPTRAVKFGRLQRAIADGMIRQLDPLGLTPKQRERSDLNAEIGRIAGDTVIGQMMIEAADRIADQYWPERSHE